MIGRLVLAIIACLATLAVAASAQSVAEQAGKAALDLKTAVAALGQAQGARDRVAALTQTIQAYERGLGALREGLRQASIREAALALQFQAKRDHIAQLLAVLTQIGASDTSPLLLLHPAGPLGSVRSGMLLADVTPALQAEAEALRGQLQELRDLRAVQTTAGTTLSGGLRAAQEARAALSRAVSDRTDLPKRLTEDPAALKRLLQNAATLASFADGLKPLPDETGAVVDFAAAKGHLPLPVLATVLRSAGEADAAGVRRPGIVLATRPRALVTAPWPATIRYLGPLLDYGNVIILDPGSGYLMILSGMETVYGELGDVIAAGAPLGLMGGDFADVAEFLVSAQNGGGARDTETLYMELRQGTRPVDPAEWFAATGE